MGRQKRILIRVDEGLYQYTLGKEAPQQQLPGQSEKQKPRKPVDLSRYMALIKHQDRYFRKFGFPTISKARQWRKSRMGRIAEGRLFPEEEKKRAEADRQQALTIQAYGEIWMKAKEASGLKYTTVRRYRSILKIHLNPAFGSLPLVGVNRAKVRELVAQLSAQGLKPKSIKNVLLCLSAIYTDAIEDGHVQHNPALKTAKLIKTSKRSEDVVAFTHEEEWAILKAAQKNYHCTPSSPVVVPCRVAGRRSRGLAARDLDIRNRCLWVQRNFYCWATVEHAEKPTTPVSQSVTRFGHGAERLFNHPGGRSDERATRLDGLVVYHSQGDIIRSNNFGIPSLETSSERHRTPLPVDSCDQAHLASRMLASGANVVYVQKQMGHSSIQFERWIPIRTGYDNQNGMQG
ncbi:MAG: hypothetical protein R3B74_11925 [Nitrospirales bacterium]|nr:site-specific integrase [Nitrospirales bacterium]